MSLVTNVVLLAINVLAGVLVARALGPHGRGEFAAIQLWAGIAGVAAMLGLPEAAMYALSRDRRAGGRVLTTATAVTFATSVVVFGVTWAVLPWLLGAQSSETVASARAFLFIVPLYGCSGVAYQLFRAAGRFDLWNALRLAVPVGWLAVLAGSALTASATPARLAVGYLSLVAASTLVAVTLAWRHVARPGRFDPVLVRPLLRFGVPSVLSSYPQMINARLDQLLMASLLGPRSLGLYVAAVAWTSPVAVLPHAVASVAFPALAAASSDDAAGALAGRYLRVTVLIGVVASAALLIITPVGLPTVLGSRFAPSVPTALVLVLAGVPLAINLVAAEILRGRGRPQSVLWGECIGVVGTVVLLMALLPPFGLVGAALASLMAYSATTGVLVHHVAKGSSVSRRRLLVPEIGDARLLAARLRERLGQLRRQPAGEPRHG